MSLENHSLLLPSGELRTLLDIGITEATVTHSAQGDDEMKLELPADLDAENICPAWGAVSLFDQNGVRRFLGYCLNLARTGKGGSQRHVLTFQGPNCLLSRITFRQLAYFAPVNASYNSIPTTTYVSRVILNRNSLT